MHVHSSPCAWACTRVQGFVLQSLKLLMKVHQRRNKRRADAIDDSALLGSNVLYAMVDPHSEWISSVTVLQSEAMLKLQLQHSQSVLAQSAAVQALGDMVTEARRGHKRFVTTQTLRSDLGQLSLNGVQELLAYVLNNKDVFYRYAPRQLSSYCLRHVFVSVACSWGRIGTVHKYAYRNRIRSSPAHPPASNGVVHT